MKKSENVGALISALAKAQLEFTPAVKSSNNPAFNSKYADLATCIDAVRPALNKHGIVLLFGAHTDVEHQTVTVTTALHHGEQWIEHTTEAPATNNKGFNVQSIGTAMTYLRRYGLQALCGLASEDDDGNSNAVDNAPKGKVKDMELEYKQWNSEFTANAEIALFNKNIVPLMRERNEEYRKVATRIAKAAGWSYNVKAGQYEAPDIKLEMTNCKTCGVIYLPSKGHTCKGVA